MKSSIEVSMSFCLSDLRKLESEGAWAEIVDGMIEAILCWSVTCFEVVLRLFPRSGGDMI